MFKYGANERLPVFFLLLFFCVNERLFLAQTKDFVSAKCANEMTIGANKKRRNVLTVYATWLNTLCPCLLLDIFLII